MPMTAWDSAMKTRAAGNHGQLTQVGTDVQPTVTAAPPHCKRAPQPPSRPRWPIVPAVSVIDELLDNNGAYSASLAEQHLDVSPRRHLAIVTCMDSRIDVFAALGLG